jgi:arylsulfatase A-like enzyme
MRIKLTGSAIMLAGCAASVVQAQKEVRPNLLVFLTDDQRLDTLGCYSTNCPIQTPNLDRLATQGIRFDNGFVTTPICVVSRASILTGRYACNTRVQEFLVTMPQDTFAQSYPVILRQQGYFTGMLGKYGVGITKEQEKEFDFYDAQAGQGPAFREYKGRKMHDAEWLTVKTGEFLDQAPKDKPFSLQVNYKEPHGSSEPAPEDDHLLDAHQFARSPLDTPEEFAKLPKYVQQGFSRVCYEKEFNKGGDPNPFLRDYYEKIVSVERSVGQIMGMLKERGLADNTVVVFLSDNGDHFGEKQLYGKWTPYEQSLRVPFIIYDPRPQASKGLVRNEMVLNIDIAPTLLDLAGVPVPKVMDGRSLLPLISDSRALASEKWRDHFSFEHYTSPSPVRSYIPRHVGVRTKEMKYVRWIDLNPPVEELYDLAKDPMETRNLAANPEFSVQLETLRKSFDQWREANPSTYTYDSYGQRPQSGAKEIDWDQFKKARPKEYAKIKAEVERLGVTWEQALNDWEVRFEICSKTGYWY